jgi:hypothetical protein
MLLCVFLVGGKNAPAIRATWYRIVEGLQFFLLNTSVEESNLGYPSIDSR